MSPPANERGGHARPRGLFAPRPRHNGGGPRHNGAADANASANASANVGANAGAAPAPESRPLAADDFALAPDGLAPRPAVQNGLNPPNPLSPSKPPRPSEPPGLPGSVSS